MKTWIMLLAILMTATTLHAATGDAILGVWNNEEKDAKIELFRRGEQYYGKIIQLKVPVYPADAQDGVPGMPKLDIHNPNPERRKAQILGLEIVRGFSYAGESKFVDGEVYDPNNGKTYSGKMTLVSQSQLDLRGFIGIPLFGRSTTWTR